MSGPLTKLLEYQFDPVEALVEALKGVTPSAAAIQQPGVFGNPTGNHEAHRRVPPTTGPLPSETVLLQQAVYGWLGFWRDHLPAAAIDSLQERLGPLERGEAPS